MSFGNDTSSKTTGSFWDPRCYVTWIVEIAEHCAFSVWFIGIWSVAKAAKTLSWGIQKFRWSCREDDWSLPCQLITTEFQSLELSWQFPLLSMGCCRVTIWGISWRTFREGIMRKFREDSKTRHWFSKFCAHSVHLCFRQNSGFLHCANYLQTSLNLYEPVWISQPTPATPSHRCPLKLNTVLQLVWAARAGGGTPELHFPHLPQEKLWALTNQTRPLV